MRTKKLLSIVPVLAFLVISITSLQAQIGIRFPSEKKTVKDPVTGTELTFLTSKPAGDSKIYQTHNQWTADGNWVIFRSNRVKGEAMAVNEKTGTIVQVSEGGFTGMLNVARKSMKLYFMRNLPAYQATQNRRGGPVQVIEVDLATLFADSESGKLKPATAYQRICGTTPAEIGAGPSGLGMMNIKTGETKFVVAVPFQVGHIQANPWMPGEIVFCWETGGKAPQRTWTVMSDGSGLRPLYPESEYEWVTHESIIADHPHPTFSADGTRIEIQSAMLSEDNKSMNICIIPVPEEWLKRKY